MNDPRSTGPEYTGKHRRDSGPGVLPPAWGRRPDSYARSESYGRPAPDSRPEPGATALPSLRPEFGFRSEAGQWPSAG